MKWSFSLMTIPIVCDNSGVRQAFKGNVCADFEVAPLWLPLFQDLV